MSEPQTALVPNGEQSVEQQPRVKPGDSATEMSFSSGENFALLQRVAAVMAKSSLVPKEYQNNIPNCIIALNMAARLKADPLMVMQNLYIVHNRPAWSAQFMIATINQCGRFSALRYEWEGEPGKSNRGCRAWALELLSNEKLYGSWITWDMVKAEGWDSRTGSKWKTMPEQMFMYRAGAWFVRAYAPELAMGLPTAEELRDIPAYRTGPDEYATHLETPETAQPSRADALTERLKTERPTPPAIEEPATSQHEPGKEEPPKAPSAAYGLFLDAFQACKEATSIKVASETIYPHLGDLEVDRATDAQLEAAAKALNAATKKAKK